jgi:hypothetical protein
MEERAALDGGADPATVVAWITVDRLGGISRRRFSSLTRTIERCSTRRWAFRRRTTRRTRSAELAVAIPRSAKTCRRAEDSEVHWRIELWERLQPKRSHHRPRAGKLFGSTSSAIVRSSTQ